MRISVPVFLDMQCFSSSSSSTRGFYSVLGMNNGKLLNLSYIPLPMRDKASRRTSRGGIELSPGNGMVTCFTSQYTPLKANMVWNLLLSLPGLIANKARSIEVL